jgi:small subunit ribosomal protein S9
MLCFAYFADSFNKFKGFQVHKIMEKPSNSFKIHGIGRRKSSVARVWLKQGTGNIEVNGVNHIEYFDTSTTRTMVEIPLKISGNEKSFDIMANVSGGGLVGQAGAIKLGIARALLATNEALRVTLRKNDLLTVDDRVKERKKYGQKGARRKFQFVKR